MTIKHALVAGEICQYVDGTVTRVPNQWVPGVVDIQWKDPRGVTNVVSGEDNFIPGAYNDLVDMVRQAREAIERDVRVGLNQSFFRPSDTEKAIGRLMVQDGEDLNNITPRRVKKVWEGMLRLYDVCNTMEEAYMCYMH